MNNLKRLVVTLCLVSVLAVTAFAGETPAPPCPPPDPGETPAPPCFTGQIATDDPANSGETETPPGAETVVVTAIVDAAFGTFLTLF